MTDKYFGIIPRRPGVRGLSVPDEEYRTRYRKVNGGIPAHRLIVEIRTGIKLKPHNHVHHVDPNDKLTNKGLFVVCENAGHHAIIERRTRAYEACGHASWRKCRECKKYDDPANLRIWEDTTRPGCEKVSHYRWKGQCVNKGDRCDMRPSRSNPRLRRGQQRYGNQLAPAYANDGGVAGGKR